MGRLKNSPVRSGSGERGREEQEGKAKGVKVWRGESSEGNMFLLSSLPPSNSCRCLAMSAGGGGAAPLGKRS